MHKTDKGDTMKKLNIALIMVCFLALSGFKDASLDNKTKDQEIKATTVQKQSTDITSPVISFKQEEDIVLKVGSKLDLNEYIEVTDEGGVKAVTSFGKFNPEQAGTYNLSVVAIDNAQNVASCELVVKVITEEEFEILEAAKIKELHELERKQRAEAREKIRTLLESNYGEGSSDISLLAESYLGMGGSCNEVAQAFLSDYLGYGVNIFNSYSISYEDARPGDLVEYRDGGKGNWHVAVYLGNGMALHGNWNGTTVISSIWVNGASDPYFQRVN